VFIDLIGRIPSYEEVVDFEQDKSPNKRAKLVGRLLNESNYQPKNNGQVFKTDDKKTLTIDYTPDAYVHQLGEHLGVWLMSRTSHPVYREVDGVLARKAVPQHTSYKDMVVELLTGQGG